MATLENTAVMFEARLRGRISDVLRPRLGEYSCAKLMSDPRRRPVFFSPPSFDLDNHHARVVRAAVGKRSDVHCATSHGRQREQRRRERQCHWQRWQHRPDDVVVVRLPLDLEQRTRVTVYVFPFATFFALLLICEERIAADEGEMPTMSVDHDTERAFTAAEEQVRNFVELTKHDAQSRV
jgi:hypothetical protein